MLSPTALTCASSSSLVPPAAAGGPGAAVAAAAGPFACASFRAVSWATRAFTSSVLSICLPLTPPAFSFSLRARISSPVALIWASRSPDSTTAGAAAAALAAAGFSGSAFAGSAAAAGAFASSLTGLSPLTESSKRPMHSSFPTAHITSKRPGEALEPVSAARAGLATSPSFMPFALANSWMKGSSPSGLHSPSYFCRSSASSLHVPFCASVAMFLAAAGITGIGRFPTINSAASLYSTTVLARTFSKSAMRGIRSLASNGFRSGKSFSAMSVRRSTSHSLM
mmetsp:Transcript_10674/g.28281  ORF Transcript_10674/g.28281 Transcript_10674/m.28281 type:complete len:282 (+) Transcript_10674:237-1082(+)